MLERRARAGARGPAMKDHTIFLLSPANLGGVRGGQVMRPAAGFPLALELRSDEGAALGDVFSFVSGLYFRGKRAYGEAFGRAPSGLAGALVMSPSEGLRFLHERVTVERLRAWAEVDIDAANPRFVEPLLTHARALARALGGGTRFVLLGSVASDKYVQPLTAVFGGDLLFPIDFIGRGDMSRGALMLRAVREGRELAYAPVLGTVLHGRRAPGIASARRRAPPEPAIVDEPRPTPALPGPRRAELVLLVGLPGAGKTTFFQQRFAATHHAVSKDRLPARDRVARRQAELVAAALAAGQSVVVDNTNVSRADRAGPIAAARAHGAAVVAYFFDCAPRECLARNAGRQGRARVPEVAIFAAAKRLQAPSADEGIDALHVVRPLPPDAFDVS